MPKFIVTLTREQSTTIIVEAANAGAVWRLVHAMTDDELLDRAGDWDVMPRTLDAVQVDEWPEESDGR